MALIVGSIGSQRIASALAIAAGRSGSYFDNGPFFGFTTTSAEALQVTRYALGLLEIPPEIVPLLTGRGELSADLSFELPHDLVFVEISSRKVVSFDGYHLNLRAVSHHFRDRPRLAGALSRFWGSDAARLRLAFLAREPAFASAEEHEKLLFTEATASDLTDDDIVLDLRRLHALIGNRLVIVTPILDEAAPPGWQAHHSDLIAVLEFASAQFGVPVLNPTAALEEFVREHERAGANEDSRHWWAAFDGHLAELIRQQFLEPAARSRFRLAPPPEHVETVPAGGRFARWVGRRKGRQQSGSGSPSENRVHSAKSFEQAVESAAWEGNWQYVLGTAQGAPDLVSGNPNLIEAVATAAWYCGYKAEALDLWRLRIDRGPLGAHRLVETAELALQCDQRALAVHWCRTAVEQDPQSAAAAVRLLLGHGEAESISELVPIVVAQGGDVLGFLGQLPAELKREALDQALTDGAVDFKQPAGEAVVRQWLAELLAHYREGNVDAVREWATRFNVLDPSHSAYGSARVLLLRSLQAQLRSLDPQTSPDRIEAVAEEIRAIDPAHVEAATTLARTWSRQGKTQEAAMLLEELACAVEQPSVQVAAINQWIVAGDAKGAAHALERALRMLGEDADTLALPRQRVCNFIARELAKRQKTGELDVVEDLRAYQEALCSPAPTATGGATGSNDKNPISNGEAGR